MQVTDGKKEARHIANCQPERPAKRLRRDKFEPTEEARIMADVNRGNRPLSPHLQVYKLPIMAVTSILTRVTGHALVAGILLLVWWLVAAISGEGAFAVANWVMTSWLGFLIMLGSVWALWYHTLAGIRHLFYDAGHLLELDMARKASWAIVIGSGVLTLLTLLIFFI